MDDEQLVLSDPDHLDAQEAADLTARLLLHLYEKRLAALANAPLPNEKLEDDGVN